MGWTFSNKLLRWALTLRKLQRSSRRCYLMPILLPTDFTWQSCSIRSWTSHVMLLKVKKKIKSRKERVSAALKQSKYALLKPENKLTKYQKNKLKQVQQVSPLSQNASAKEAFRAILIPLLIGSMGLWDCWIGWQKLAVLFKKTISRWFGEVTGYFESGTTSGAVEVSTIS